MPQPYIDPSAIYLGRQPILDRAQQLIGFEFLFRHGPTAAAIVDNHVTATATVVAHTFSELILAHSLGKLQAFVNVDEDFLLDDAIELLPPEQVVLEILESVIPNPIIIARCARLKAMGFHLALDDVTCNTDVRLCLLEYISIVKIDLVSTPAAHLVALVNQLRSPGLRLLAEKVETAEDIAHCMNLGFELFQGYYFARPSIISGRKMNHSKLALLKLLTLINEDADTRAIEDNFKQAPSLSINLLRLVNSVGSGLSVRISSLRHAITLLGRRQLQRWLQILIYADIDGKNSSANNPLLQLAATRGRFMENLAKSQFNGEESLSDQSFMCGVLSLTPALFGTPINEILLQINLAQHINDALLQRKGKLGRLLQIVEATERDDAALSTEQQDQTFPELGSNTVNKALTEAILWARSITEESTAD